MTVEITEANLTGILESDMPVMIDFYGTWCKPCQALSPIIDELGNEYDNVIIAKLDVDNQELQHFCASSGIRNIPAMLFFKDGEIVNKLVGMNSKDVIKSKLDSLI